MLSTHLVFSFDSRVEPAKPFFTAGVPLFPSEVCILGSTFAASRLNGCQRKTHNLLVSFTLTHTHMPHTMCQVSPDYAKGRHQESSVLLRSQSRHLVVRQGNPSILWVCCVPACAPVCCCNSPFLGLSFTKGTPALIWGVGVPLVSLVWRNSNYQDLLSSPDRDTESVSSGLPPKG